MEQIQQSKEYEKFELLGFNRDVRRLKPLQESMRKHGFLSAYPLHVVMNGNGKYKIKAGHHRFTVAQSLGIPVKFVVSDDDVSIHELERATTHWTMKDYLTSYARQGNPNYTEVQRYFRETGIPLMCAVSMLGGECANSHNKIKPFKAGTFEVKGRDHAWNVAGLISEAKNAGVTFALNSMFVSAISRMVWVPEFDQKRFIKKVCSHGHVMEKRPSVAGYSSLIEEVYNRQSTNRIPLCFMADQAARSRAAVQRV